MTHTNPTTPTTPTPEPTPAPLHADQLTWAVLLGRWVDLAQQALGLPNDAAGLKMRASVPDIVMLQAVTFALGELDQVPLDQRNLGLDRAALLIEKHSKQLRSRWPSESIHPELQQLITDAQQAWQQAAGQ